MKKFIQLLLILSLLAAPALIVNYSSASSTRQMLAEHEKQLFLRLQQELQTQNQMVNPIFEITQHFSVFMDQAITRNLFEGEQSAVDNAGTVFQEFFQSLAEQIGFKSQNSVEYRFLNHRKVLSFAHDQKSQHGLVEKLTGAMMRVQEAAHSKLPVTAPVEKLTEICNNEMKTFFDLNFLLAPFHLTKINRVVLREPDSFKLLVSLRSQFNFLLNSLFDLTAFDDDYMARRKASAWKSDSSGLILLKQGEENKPVFSSYLATRTPLIKGIVKRVIALKEHLGNFKIDGHMVLVSPASPQKIFRIAIAAKLPVQRPQKGMSILIILLAIAGCCIGKLATEAILFDRGISLSLRTFIILTFITVTLMPFLSSIYLTSEYVVSNFKVQKNQVAQNLSQDLLNMDLQTFSAFRNSINKAKSLNSIEKLAALTGLPESSDVRELVISTMNKLWQVNSKPLFSEIWIFATDIEFGGVEYAPHHNEYNFKKSENAILNELFVPRFRQLLENQSAATISRQQEKEQIKFDEVKGEVLNNVFLNLFGEETFYQLQQEYDSIINFASFFERNSVINVPIYQNGRIRYVFSWVFASSEVRRHFPGELLNIAPGKPVNLTVYGNDKFMNALPLDLNLLSEKFPVLIRMAKRSHLATTRLVMQDANASGSTVYETRPARYSDYILCGQRETRSLESISNELTSQALGYFAILILTGLLFSILTSMYFTIPIRQLTDATREIIAGHYATRLSESHPDEFASSARAFNKMASGLAEGELLRKFVSESVRSLADPGAGDHEQAQLVEATILFSSIRNFHDLQQTVAPEQLFAIMQAHLSAAVECSAALGGEIDKMIEDKIMIVFPHRNDQPDPVCSALKTSLHINKVLKKAFSLNTAAGINSGEVVSGVMGAANVRLAKTVVGDTVNLAARLASVAANLESGGIVISGTTVKLAATAEFRFEKLPISNVKGKTHTVEAYLVKELWQKQPV